MNDLLAERYDEIVHRLAVGVEPRDGLRATRTGGAGLDVTLEHPSAPVAARPLAHAGGRWSIRYVRRLPDHVDLRIDDASRRFVPRRMRFPIVAIADVLADEAAGGHTPALRRTWRPMLFPGAAYALASSATGLRGRVLRDDRPVRWARVEARLPGSPSVLWRAHGDDRGEFLLAVGADPGGHAELPALMTLSITAIGPDPAPAAPAGGTSDRLWDMPIELLAAPASPAADDPVSLGETLPTDYDPGVTFTRTVDLIPGQIRSDVAPFVLA
ncbi:MAG: hypothetical protein QOG42_2032 [Solirubrobacteraceae bacterium]|jgi:hypothetical protein|nr:hypothetical protein [Solirubrobacteraceae bacterium]